jgi:hypothetical protein
MFRDKRFAREIIRPVSYRDAQWFRWLTVAHAFVPLVFAGGFARVLATADVLEEFGNGGVWAAVKSYVLFLLSFVVATGLPSYFFHPRWLPTELQNRAIAMSYYTCAALAWMWVPMILAIVGFLFLNARNEAVALLLNLIAAILVLLTFVAWWFELRRLAARILRRAGRVTGVTLGVPALWILAAIVLWVVVPYGMLIVESFLASIA